MRRWRIPSGGFLVESPERVTSVPRGALWITRFVGLDAQGQLVREYQSSSFGLDDYLHQSEYEVRGSELVHIESLQPKQRPDRVTVVLSGLVELPPI